jgi:hypothetical protein
VETPEAVGSVNGMVVFVSTVVIAVVAIVIRRRQRGGNQS